MPLEIEVKKDLLDDVFKTKKIEWYELGEVAPFDPNQHVILKTGDVRLPCRATATGETLKAISRKECNAAGIKSRNEEQLLALDVLLDDSIPLVTLTGRAGSGKSLLALAAAIHKFGKYDGIVLIKPQSQVGRYDLGTLPGTIDEKYNPYLGNFFCNLEVVLGDVNEQTLGQYNIETQPLQLIRGVSWRNKFIIADEVQVLNRHEILTLGTRVGEGSKLILMGDQRQRDENIAIADTGLNMLERHPKFAKSPLAASVELVKVERSPLVELFADILELE